jgi:hypothetical protein
VDKLKKVSWTDWWLLLTLVAGLAARMRSAMCGQNFDMDSFKTVAAIVCHGENVYAWTDRYNYGPVWFQILRVMHLLAGHDETIFRYLIAAFLSLVDVGIFLVLRRKFGNVAACLFFLNPISIIITGYHSQFDNLAVLLGLLAVVLVGDGFDEPINRRRLSGLVVLGLSLATKHILFAFPFWLAVKQRGFRQKLETLAIPIAIFCLGFVPYWYDGKSGIVRNVFLYRSLQNNYFFNMFVPECFQLFLTPVEMWLALLTVFAFVFRRKPVMESLLLYTCVLVAASPAIANQYLAIPVPFVATCVNVFTVLYTCVGTWHLFINVNGFGFGGGSVADLAAYLLCLALVWSAWKRSIVGLLERCVFEVKNQFGLNRR